MLETASDRLSQRGGPHFGSPDKLPAVRLDAIARAGRLRIPYTSGILIGIGETRRERVEALLALRELHEEGGHLQEVIVQNFRAKPGTKMAGAPEPSLDDHLWTIAVARLLLPPDVSVQAPPNLAHEHFPRLLEAGIDDWGGVSPVTPDHVNPEAPWPALDRLAEATAAAGLTLVPRLTVYPRFLREPEEWLAPRTRAAALHQADALGLARGDALVRGHDAGAAAGWRDGRAAPCRRAFAAALATAERGGELGEADAAALLSARGPEVALLTTPPTSCGAPSAATGHLRRLPEHQLHERLLLPLRLLRVLEGPPGREPARPGLPARPRRGRAPLAGGVGARRDGGLPAGRHPPRLSRPLVPVRARGHQGRAAAAARARVLAARGLAGRRHRGLVAALLPRAPARRRARLAAGHRGRDPGRRGAARALPRQGLDRAVARGHAHGARGRAALDVDDHVRPRRGAREPGAPPARAARPAARDRRLQRVRAAAVRARRGADLPQGPRAGGADVRRGGRAARRGAPDPASAHRQRAGLLDEARARGRAHPARRRRQRPRRDAHERVDQPRRRRRARPGMPARAHGRA